MNSKGSNKQLYFAQCLAEVELAVYYFMLAVRDHYLGRR